MLFFKAKKSSPELEERVSTVERKLKDLELEWENAYDKIRHMMGRIAKRAATVAQSEAPTEPQYTGVEESISSSPLTPMMSRLSPAQQRTQMEILRRRGVKGIQ